MNMKWIFFLLLTAFSGPQVRAQTPGSTALELSGSVEWEGGEINAALRLDLRSFGLSLPGGRIRGEEILTGEYPRVLRPAILSLQADSSTTVAEYLRRNGSAAAAPGALDTLLLEARKTAPSLSADLSRITGQYRLLLKDLRSLLTGQVRRLDLPPPLIPAPTADYTGVIIIADRALPIHGRNSSALVQPCLFPKIRDTATREIYSLNTPDHPDAMVAYTGTDRIFRPTPSGLEGDLAALAGPNPLRIFARGVFGVCPTDPIIDQEDALKIISSEHNRRLLREGRVIFVVHRDTLTYSLK
jgi:hypothetical protein